MKERKYALAESLKSSDIKAIRKKLQLTQKDFAKLVNVSAKTVAYWESGKAEISGPIVTLVKILSENIELAATLEVPEKQLPLRLWY